MGAFIAHHQEADSSPALTFVTDSEPEITGKGNDFEAGYALDYEGGNKEMPSTSDKNALAQLIAVAVLEFGIILHRHVLLRSISAFHAN